MYNTDETSLVLGSCFLSIMALVTRIFSHKHTKHTTDDMSTAKNANEHHRQLLHISASWRRIFAPKQDHVKGHWVPTLSGMIKAGDERLFPSALIANIYRHSGELSLKALYEVFAEELRSRPMTERSAYAGEIPRFLSSTKRVTVGPRRVQSVSHKANSKAQSDGPLKTQRLSLDLTVVEKGFARSMSVKKPAPTLVSMQHGLSGTDKERASQTSWMKDGQIAESRYGSIGIKVSPAELAALSIILGSPLIVGVKSDSAAFTKGTFNISISSAVTEDGKHQITLHQHKRNISHLPARGSGFSPLFAKHMAAGSLPYMQSKKTVHSILVSAHTLKVVQASSLVCLHDSNFKTAQSKFLTSLPSSRELSFHIASIAIKSPPTNTLIDAISALPFMGGLVPLASIPIIKITQFVASGGLAPARLLQRLEGLVDKVNKHAPHLNTFGPLYEPHNAALLYRERERLGKLVTNINVTDTIADKASRMQRYITLLERLMALVPDLKPQDVLAAVQEATKKELERSHTDSIAAHQGNLSRASLVVDSHGCPESDARSRRLSTNSHASGPRSNRSSVTSITTVASPSSSSGFPSQNLGKQVEQLLKAELPLSVESIGTVARMIIVAWTLSVGCVAWEEGEEGFRVPDLDKLPEKMILC
jgi:hypothetical protein